MLACRRNFRNVFGSMANIVQHSVRGKVVIISTPFKSDDTTRTVPREFPGSDCLFPRNSLGLMDDESGRGQVMQDGRLDEQGAYPRLLATLGVVVAGTALVRSAPPGPGKHEFYTAGWRPDQASKQMTHFGSGQREQRPPWLG